jgi:monovalent cation/hydrogen antiporter
MHNIEVVVILLAVMAALSAVAEMIRISYPVLLVVVGLIIGLIPGLPIIELKPEVVFFMFLPPLLYAAAWATSWHDFKKMSRPITLLAVGLVLFTTSIVAIIAHYMIPDFSWPLAFLLGAIISPPDAVAATSVTKGLNVPKRVLIILEGESLVNDASGLIAFRYALIAVTTGNFVFWEASLNFIMVVIGGIIVGLLVGYVFYYIHKLCTTSSTIDVILTLLTPFIAYTVAERIHTSGVLAVVVAGLFLTFRASEMFSHQTRIHALGVWDTMVFILNGIVFILMGLQLPTILKGIETNYSVPAMVGYGLLIGVSIMVIRLLWVFPGAYVPRMLSHKIRETETRPSWKAVFITGWTGMRGVVSLAAALALPVTLENGSPFPHRDLILFVTFVVIMFTLVFQGLSLPYIIKKLDLPTSNQEEIEEQQARMKLASSVILHIEENFALGVVHDDVLNQVKNKYELKINHLNKKVRTEENIKDAGHLFDQLNKMQKELLTVERNVILQMHKQGTVGEEVLRRLEYELDLEESRLELDEKMVIAEV